MTVAQHETDSPIIPVARLQRRHQFKPEAVDWVIQQTQIPAEHRRREDRRINSFILVERFVGQFFAFVIGIGDVAAGSWVAALHEQPRAGAGIASVALTGLGRLLTTYGSQNITRAPLPKRRTPDMARRLDDVMAALPAERRARVEKRALELRTLKDLRIAAEQTQAELAAALGVGQDTISRLEKRSDMLLSTLRHYVEGMGGRLDLVAQFPDRPPVVIEHLGVEKTPRRRN